MVKSIIHYDLLWLQLMVKGVIPFYLIWLQLILYCEVHNNLVWLQLRVKCVIHNDLIWLQLMVHEPGEVPAQADAFTTEPGKELRIAITKEEVIPDYSWHRWMILMTLSNMLMLN